MAFKQRRAEKPQSALPPGRRVHDWSELAVGDDVELLEEDGLVTAACVETLAEDGSIIWLKPTGTGHRRLWMRSDPVTIYKH